MALALKLQGAEFWAAARTVGEIPKPRAPEVAVAGRSNVGKSTLLNRLLGRKRLARTSTTPGCTRGLMFYKAGEQVVLVDLPGYGWARRSSEEREAWKGLVEGYLSQRRALAGVLILVDVRRGPDDDEKMLADYLDSLRVQRVWVLTKCDKLSRDALIRRLKDLEGVMDGEKIAVSGKSPRGIESLAAWIGRAKDEHIGKR